MKYRAEIDGLRAFAVLPVILFHAGFPYFEGGYIGVDIFFVISGYLITTILMQKNVSETYSIWEFYERRIRRIFPALFFVLASTSIFGYFFYRPSSLMSYGESLISTIFFYSNIYFWQDTDYFAFGAEFKPLLHTWSLSVEEQFYIFFPPLLALTYRFKRKTILPLCLTIAAISLALAQILGENSPTPNFFLTPTRIWELLAGSMCAIYMMDRQTKPNPWLGSLGLILIVGSMAVFDSATHWPSFYALLPIVGTCFVILFATDNSGPVKILSWQPFVFIGLISYSAYLWHQPIFASARLLYGAHIDLGVMALLSVASLFLAYLSWRFVEAPFRRKTFLSRKQVFGIAALSSAILLACALFFIRSDGALLRYSQADQTLFKERLNVKRYGDGPSFYNKHRLTPFAEDKLKVFVIGDSFGQDFMSTLSYTQNFDAMSLSTHRIRMACGNLFLPPEMIEPNIAAGEQLNCKSVIRYNDPAVLERIKQADVVVLSSSWRLWQARLLQQSIDNIKAETSARIVVIGRKYFGPHNIDTLLKMAPEERVQAQFSVDESFLKLHTFMTKPGTFANFVDMQKYVCPSISRCRHFDDKGASRTFDGEHSTIAAEKALAKQWDADPEFWEIFGLN